MLARLRYCGWKLVCRGLPGLILPGLIMGGRTGLDPDQARLKLRKELKDVRPPLLERFRVNGRSRPTASGRRQ